MSEKTCTKCEKIKKLSDFSKAKANKDGYCGLCRICRAETQREYDLKRIDKIKEYQKKYQKEWYLKNKDKKDKQQKISNLKRIDKIKEYRKKYNLDNRDKINEYYRNYIMPTNYKMGKSIRSNILSSIRHSKNKKYNSTVELIGCSIDFFKEYIESKFTKNMNWDNHGVNGWHFDHIKPCSSFDLSDPEQQKLCFHYTNYQPLWATREIAIQYGESTDYIGNLEKGYKYNEDFSR